MKKQLAYRPLPDYLNEDEEINAGLEETGDLETDSGTRSRAMERILRRGVPEDWLREHGSVDDYPCWFSVSFRTGCKRTDSCSCAASGISATSTSTGTRLLTTWASTCCE